MTENLTCMQEAAQVVQENERRNVRLHGSIYIHLCTSCRIVSIPSVVPPTKHTAFMRQLSIDWLKTHR